MNINELSQTLEKETLKHVEKHARDMAIDLASNLMSLNHPMGSFEIQTSYDVVEATNQLTITLTAVNISTGKVIDVDTGALLEEEELAGGEFVEKEVE